MNKLISLGLVGLLGCEAPVVSLNPQDSRYPFCKEQFCDKSLDIRFSPQDVVQEFNGSQYSLKLKGINEHKGDYSVALEINGQEIGYSREMRLPGNPLIVKVNDCFSSGNDVLLLTENPEETEVNICFMKP
jgi:hypothetical protein